jgi:hypothetical protein
MNVTETIRTFLEFFRDRRHRVVPGSSLVRPDGDPVLFTTAGMHPLTRYLEGRPHPHGRRLAGLQRCLRTTDLDEVGDDRHLTVFQMLGSWSLGDYDGPQSLRWGWELLTEHLGIGRDRLHATVFGGDEHVGPDLPSWQTWTELRSPAPSCPLDSGVDWGSRVGLVHHSPPNPPRSPNPPGKRRADQRRQMPQRLARRTRPNQESPIERGRPAALPQRRAAVRAAEAGDERGSGRRLDLDVCAEGGEGWHERTRIGVLDAESLEGKPARRRSGRMLGIAPADEERDQVARRLAARHPPPERRSGGTDPPAVDHLTRVVAVTACPGDRRVDVVAGQRPSSQPAVAYPVEPEGSARGRLRLIGIGRDDLQIRPGAEREQRVVGAQPGVLASGLRPDAEALRYVGDRRREVGNGVDQVVDQHAIQGNHRREPMQAAPAGWPGRWWPSL